jgi:hypothetical protein
MSDVIQFEERRRAANHCGNPVSIKKIVDGKTIECVNVDALTPDQLSKYFAQEADDLGGK